jgi:hypothetical protein
MITVNNCSRLAACVIQVLLNKDKSGSRCSKREYRRSTTLFIYNQQQQFCLRRKAASKIAASEHSGIFAWHPLELGGAGAHTIDIAQRSNAEPRSGWIDDHT